MRKIIDTFFVIIIILSIVGSAFFIFSQPGDDIWHNSLDLGLFVFTIVPLLIIELGLYYNCMYFFFKKNKKKWKTVFNVLMCIISCAMLGCFCGGVVWIHMVNTWMTILLVLCIAAVILWIVYALLCEW